MIDHRIVSVYFGPCEGCGRAIDGEAHHVKREGTAGKYYHRRCCPAGKILANAQPTELQLTHVGDC